MTDFYFNFLKFNNLKFHIKIISRSNILLGIYHFLKRAISVKKTYRRELPSEITDLFSFQKRKKEIIDYFEQNNNYKKKLLKIADEFLNNKVQIYNRKVFFAEYTVSNFNNNRQKKEIKNKDIRFHWEIFRCKYLFNVGLAYYLTKKEVYSESLVNFIKNWREYSPIVDDSLPYNGMEAAIKLINLSWLDIFLADSPDYNDEIRSCLISSLVIHAEYVYKNYDITFYGLESNHGLSCALGLIYASLLFPEYRNSKKWCRFGMRALKRALRNQFSDDGVNFESSVQYHRFVFELLIFLYAALYKSKENIDVFVEDSIKNIGCALKALTHKNGFISRIGDSDGGKFLYDLGSIAEFNSMGYLNWFIKDNKERYYETLFIEDIPELKHFISEDSDKYKVGKYISYKDSNISLIISANEIGTLGKGNHQHNDFLSFELYSDFPFIVDPWSYCYTGDKELRNLDRCTKSHNTIELDDRDIVETNYDRLFEMLGNIKVDIDKIVDKKEQWYASLQHDGYMNLITGSQKHIREFNIHKIENRLCIKDTLKGKGNHTAVLNFYIPKQYWKLKRKNSCLFFQNDKEEFKMEIDTGDINVSDGFISEYFINRQSAYNISLKRKYSEKTIIYTIIHFIKK